MPRLVCAGRAAARDAPEVARVRVAAVDVAAEADGFAFDRRDVDGFALVARDLVFPGELAALDACELPCGPSCGAAVPFASRAIGSPPASEVIAEATVESVLKDVVMMRPPVQRGRNESLRSDVFFSIDSF